MKRLLVLLLLIVPIAAWAFYKPVRVLAPELVAGVTCVTGLICLEDAARREEALALYQQAWHYVSTEVGVLEDAPRAIFCSSERCFRAFGFERAAAQSVAGSVIVVSPRGWQSHYLKHEMIHHLQVAQLGSLGQLMAPEWFIEGMAYALSNDPRATLAEPWQSYRHRFDNWFEGVGRERLWQEAARL